jgi:hypothetical protein
MAEAEELELPIKGAKARTQVSASTDSVSILSFHFLTTRIHRHVCFHGRRQLQAFIEQ